MLVIALAGAAGALLNGVLIGYIGLSFFVVTLGTMTAIRGAVYLVTDGRTIQTFDHPLVQQIANDQLGPFPITGYAMIALLALSFVALRYTRFGRGVYTIGGNREVAYRVGIPVRRVEMLAYGIAGAAAGIAGVIATGRTGGAAPIAGGGFELEAAAAVLLGGTSFIGGIGGITGTLIGVAFLATLRNGMTLSGLDTFWQQVAVGIVLIVALLLDRLRLAQRG
jgi:ribose transport system permease protein